MLEAGRIDALAGGAGPIVVPQAQPQAVHVQPTLAATIGVPPLSPAPGLMPPPLVEHQYHIGVNGQQYGPFGMQQLGQMLQTAQIAAAGTKVWRQGLAGWVEMTQLAELAPLLAPAAPAMPPPLV